MSLGSSNLIQIALHPAALGGALLSTTIIACKIYATAAIQGSLRFKTGFRPPEDGSLIKKNKVKQSFGMQNGELDPSKAKAALETETRWARIVTNDFENLPIGLAVIWGTLFTCAYPQLHAVMAITFSLARCLHTYYYAKATQPHRAIAWSTGVLMVLGMLMNGLFGFFLKIR